VQANSTGGQGSRRAVAPSDDVDDDVPAMVRVPQFHKQLSKYSNSVPHRKNTSPLQTPINSAWRNSRVSSENHMKPINTPRGVNAENCNAKEGGTQ
jgi:hypothetical protein